MAGTRFDEHGNEYRIAEAPEGCCLAARRIVYEDGETGDGELLFVRTSALRDAAPRQKVDSRIAEARATLADLRDQIRTHRQELKAFEDGADHRMARLKRHKGLARLDDYMAGRITHYVEVQYGPPKIVAFEDATTDGAGGRRDQLKLLTLFGRTNGELEWRLNEWNDGSGTNTTVVPCTSHCEAGKIVGELFAAHEAKALDPGDLCKPGRPWATRATELGIAMSDRYLSAMEASEASANQAAIANLEAKLHRLRKK